MGMTNPFPNHFGSVFLSPLTFSSDFSDDESIQLSPLTVSSNEEPGQSSPLSASGDDEETVVDVALRLGSTELQDAPLYRPFGGRGMSKSCDDMLLAPLVYRESEMVCLDPLQGEQYLC